MLIAYLQSQIGKAIGLEDPLLLDTEQGLFDVGLDSLLAVKLPQAKLQGALGEYLPATLAIDHPTIVGLADFILDEGIIDEVGRRRGVTQPFGQPIAVVGMGCRPGAPTAPRPSGGCSAGASTPWGRCHRLAGTPTVTSIPIPRPRAR